MADPGASTERDGDVNNKDTETLEQMAKWERRKRTKYDSKCERCDKHIVVGTLCAACRAEFRKHPDGPANLTSNERGEEILYCRDETCRGKEFEIEVWADGHVVLECVICKTTRGLPRRARLGPVQDP